MAVVVDRIAGGGGVSIPVSLTTSMGATTTEGILLGATNTATAGAQVFSPSLHFQGSGWKTNATAGAQSCDWKVEVQPVQGTANPWSELVFGGSLNGGAYKKLMSLRHGFQTGSGEDDTWAEFRIGNMTDSKSGQLIFTANTDRSKMSVSSYAVQSDFVFTWSNSNTSYATADTGLSRISAGVVGVGTGAAGSNAGTINANGLITNNVSIAGGAAQYALTASSGGASVTYGVASELLTLSTGGTTTDTAANLLPANSVILAVTARVTTTITTATSWQLGDPTVAGRFTTANSTMTANTTDIGTLHYDGTGTSGQRQVAAAKVRVTTVGTPGAGAIRITVFYMTILPPQS